MTAGDALAQAAVLRPGARVSTEMRLGWLREADGLIRERFFARCDADPYGDVGADRTQQPDEETELLVPAPFDALYPHYLCARIDAALGENDRYAGEQGQYNEILGQLAAWLRRSYPPRAGCQWKW